MKFFEILWNIILFLLYLLGTFALWIAGGLLAITLLFSFINFLFSISLDLGAFAVFAIIIGIAACFGGGYTVISFIFKN